VSRDFVRIRVVWVWPEDSGGFSGDSATLFASGLPSGQIVRPATELPPVAVQFPVDKLLHLSHRLQQDRGLFNGAAAAGLLKDLLDLLIHPLVIHIPATPCSIPFQSQLLCLRPEVGNELTRSLIINMGNYGLLWILMTEPP